MKNMPVKIMVIGIIKKNTYGCQLLYYLPYILYMCKYINVEEQWKFLMLDNSNWTRKCIWFLNKGKYILP